MIERVMTASSANPGGRGRAVLTRVALQHPPFKGVAVLSQSQRTIMRDVQTKYEFHDMPDERASNKGLTSGRPPTPDQKIHALRDAIFDRYNSLFTFPKCHYSLLVCGGVN